MGVGRRRARCGCATVVLPHIMCLAPSAVLGVFQFPLPVDVKQCLVESGKHMGPGFVGVDGGKGRALDLKCLHQVLPEKGSRGMLRRFELAPPSFSCTDEVDSDGQERKLCRGSIGNAVVQSAFSRESTRMDYTQWQYRMQQWLGRRCGRHADLEEAELCEQAFKSFQYYAPTLEADGHAGQGAAHGQAGGKPEGASRHHWRDELVAWLGLDEDEEVFEGADPGAYDPDGSESMLSGAGMTQRDMEFFLYMTEAPKEWERDPLGVMRRFYSPEEVKLMHAQASAAIQDEAVREALMQSPQAWLFKLAEVDLHQL